MASATRGLSKFIRETSALFHKLHHINDANALWTRALRGLRSSSDGLYQIFSKLRVHKVSGAGKHLNIGRIKGREFSRLLRLGRSASAFARASGGSVKIGGRALQDAFSQMNRTARKVMPDRRVLTHSKGIASSRLRLIVEGTVDAGERVLTKSRLLEIIRKNPLLHSRAEKTLSKVSRTRKLLYLGGSIVATVSITGGLVYLAEEAVRHAARNSGCFLYTTNNGSSAEIRKCRVVGCSCPVHTDATVTVSCEEASLWEKMRLSQSACAPVSDGEKPYCVHCNWQEENPDSVDYVDMSQLPNDAYVQCEKQDALDALHDIVNSTIDDIGDQLEDLGKGISTSISTGSLRFVPIVLAVAVLAFIVGLVAAVYRYVAPKRSSATITDAPSTVVSYYR